jgi:RNA polymerase sigma-70 factor (ECF subfamily)
MEKNDARGVCDEIIFSAFFKNHVKALRNYLYFKFGNDEQANDMAQEAFIKLWERCSEVPPEKA